MLQGKSALIAEKLLASAGETLRPEAGQIDVLTEMSLHHSDKATMMKARMDRLPLMCRQGVCGSGATFDRPCNAGHKMCLRYGAAI